MANTRPELELYGILQDEQALVKELCTTVLASAVDSLVDGQLLSGVNLVK